MFRAEFPLVRIILTTLIRRTEDVLKNGPIADTNALIRAGSWEVFDLEAAHPDFSAASGNSTSALYQADGTHLTGAGISIAAAALQAIL